MIDDGFFGQYAHQIVDCVYVYYSGSHVSDTGLIPAISNDRDFLVQEMIHDKKRCPPS